MILRHAGTWMVCVFTLAIFLISCNGEKKDEKKVEKKVEQQSKSVPDGYVDLGLPSGTLWKSENESGYYSFDEAVEKYGSSLPTKKQWKELQDKCTWTWDENRKGSEVKGPNGNSIFLKALGYRGDSGVEIALGNAGYYWSSTPKNSDFAWGFVFFSGGKNIADDYRRIGQTVRLVHN